MNVYDFDQTVFFPDSSYLFVLYCLRHYPRCVLPSLPGSILPALQYFREKKDARKLKEHLFSFLARLPDVDTAVEQFWKKNRKNIQIWYLRQKKPDDVIISASPEFLLAPVCRELGVSLLATPMDRYTGKIYGLNCHDREKVRRFREMFPQAIPEEFYSDSLSDSPMAELAERAYLVKHEEILPWPTQKA